MPGRTIDMTGQTIGLLTVVRREGSKGGQAMWLCNCKCGNEKLIPGGSLRSGKVQSCGCIYKSTRQAIARKSIAKTTHGDSFARLYFVWQDMKARCYREKDISYKNYGARGIAVCDEWRENYEAFRGWAFANGYDQNAARGTCTLDRIDTNGDYSPDNCRWISAKDQAENRRNTPQLTINGETASIVAWAAKTGLPRNLIYSRYKRGWSGEDLISPQDQHRRRKCALRYTQECQQPSKHSTD